MLDGFVKVRFVEGIGPMTNTPIAALRELVRLKAMKDSGKTYTVDEKQRAWEAAREALAEYDTAKGAEPPSPAITPNLVGICSWLHNDARFNREFPSVASALRQELADIKKRLQQPPHAAPEAQEG